MERQPPASEPAPGEETALVPVPANAEVVPEAPPSPESQALAPLSPEEAEANALSTFSRQFNNELVRLRPPSAPLMDLPEEKGDVVLIKLKGGTTKPYRTAQGAYKKRFNFGIQVRVVVVRNEPFYKQVFGEAAIYNGRLGTWVTTSGSMDWDGNNALAQAKVRYDDRTSQWVETTESERRKARMDVLREGMFALRKVQTQLKRKLILELVGDDGCLDPEEYEAYKREVEAVRRLAERDAEEEGGCSAPSPSPPSPPAAPAVGAPAQAAATPAAKAAEPVKAPPHVPSPPPPKAEPAKAAAKKAPSSAVACGILPPTAAAPAQARLATPPARKDEAFAAYGPPAPSPAPAAPPAAPAPAPASPAIVPGDPGSVVWAVIAGFREKKETSMSMESYLLWAEEHGIGEDEALNALLDLQKLRVVFEKPTENSVLLFMSAESDIGAVEKKYPPAKAAGK